MRGPTIQVSPTQRTLSTADAVSGVSASKVEHSYVLKRVSDGIILAEATSILACVSAEGKVRRVPGFMYPGE